MLNLCSRERLIDRAIELDGPDEASSLPEGIRGTRGIEKMVRLRRLWPARVGGHQGRPSLSNDSRVWPRLPSLSIELRLTHVLVGLVAILLLQPALWGQSRERPGGAKPRPRSGNTSASPAKREAPSHFEKAEGFLKEAKFQEAIAEYQRSLEDYPENEAALFGLALAQTQAGMPEQAAVSYEAAIRINPQLWEAEANLGMLLGGQQRFDRALPHLQRAVELNPQSVQAAVSLARTLESLGRLPDAVAGYLKALTLFQNDSEKCDIYATLGDLYMRTKLWDDAEKHLAAAWLCQRSAAVALQLAHLLMRKGEFGRSAELLQPLAARQPEDTDVQELLGRALAKKGSFVEAASALEQALKHQQDSQRRQEISLELAEAYQEAGQTDKALQLLEAISANSANARLHFHLGAVYLRQRNFEAAQASFLRALQLNPGYVECYSNLGSLFMVQEKYPEAITAFSRFRAARPEIAGTYFYMGLAFDKLNDVENAFSHYRRFLELDQGKSDKQGFQARARMKVLEKRLKRR